VKPPNPPPARTGTARAAEDVLLCFSSPEAALKLIAALRWPNGVICPKCGGARHSFLPTRRVWKCLACRKQFSAKAGTIFERSPLSLSKWLVVVWQVAESRNRVSSYEIARTVRVTQKTAWFMLRRIRRALPQGYFDGQPSA
jgi:transposase-like protein